MPSARRRKNRGHPVADLPTEMLLDRGEADPLLRPSTEADPTVELAVPELKTPSADQAGKTRIARTGEIVQRATFWFAKSDLELVERLQRVVDVPGLSGVPDKSAVIREAVRRLAAGLLTDRE